MNACPVDVLATRRMHLQQLAAAHDARASFFRRDAKPTARASHGDYKPVIKYPDGRTEVCGQSSETRYGEWVDGKPNPRTAYSFANRGVTFPDRTSAIDYAARCISRRADSAEADAARVRAALARCGGAA